MNSYFRELGRLKTDTGDLVAFSTDAIEDIARRLDDTPDNLIDSHNGVRLEFHADGVYGIDQAIAVNDDGKTTSVVIVGADPERFTRLLRVGEPNFREFYESHPAASLVGRGERFDRDAFAQIASEYRTLLRENHDNQ